MLSHSEIVNCIAESLPLWNCNHKHSYAKIKHIKLITNKISTKITATGDELSVEIATDEARHFSKMKKTVEMVGCPKRFSELDR